MDKWKNVDIRSLEDNDSELKENLLIIPKDNADELYIMVLEKPKIMQLLYIRRADQPKSTESKDDSNKFYEISITDGRSRFTAVYLDEHISKFDRKNKNGTASVSLKNQPGSKLQLTGMIEVWSDVLFLNPQNTTFLGGIVDEIIKQDDERKAKSHKKLFT